MEPPLKKQKTDDTMPPIVFASPGLKPDTRLTVFEQEFYVHFVVLKLHSAFFRKFLDSPDKANIDKGTASSSTSSSTTMSSLPATAANPLLPTPSSSSYADSTSSRPLEELAMGLYFKYDWVTKIDEDGKPHLVCRSSKNEPYNLSTFKGCIKGEVRDFEKLLCAIYNRHYCLEDVPEFLRLVGLADYYCALPALSQTLDSAMMKSPEFVRQIRYNSQLLFVAAAKIHNALLFREALIWIVGPHSNPEFKCLKDRRLRAIAKCTHGELSTKVLVVIQSLLVDLKIDYLENNSEGLTKSYHESWDSSVHDELCLPQYFRILTESLAEIFIDEDLRALLQSNLQLCRERLEAGKSDDDLEGHFLCAEIVDEDLPWDPEEVDY